MLGRFSSRLVAKPGLLPGINPLPPGLDTDAPPPVAIDVKPAPAAPTVPAAPVPTEGPAAPSRRLLEAKVRLHRRLIEELNLAALEKLPEDELKREIHGIVSGWVTEERLPLNREELNGFIQEVMDEMTGLGPLEPLLKDPTIADILINGHENILSSAAACSSRCPRCSRTRRI
jgi:pilus assembly protein CpaF